MESKITPKSFILSVFQAAGDQAVPVKAIVSAGSLFGFTGNTIRVTIARLIRERTIESDERGLYRLGDRSREFSRYIEGWRKGEGRIRKWERGWVCCLTPKATARHQAENKRAFRLMGFREGLPGLWVRPDNLTIPFEDLKNLLLHFCKIDPGEVFVGSRFSETLLEQWQRYLWPVEKRLREQKTFLGKIRRSADRIEDLPLGNAVMESYLVGSEAIRLLFTDPLLPEEMMSGRYRRKLHQAMLEYDTLGRRIWSRRFADIRIDKSPAHLQLVAGMM